jgi:uncharacterized protein YjbJ (UPF0337 family)
MRRRSRGPTFASVYESGLARKEPLPKGVAMNWDEIAGKWKEVSGQAREKWGKLTDDDWQLVKGKKEQLVGRIQQRYGIAKAEAEKQADEWADEVSAPASKAPR